MWKLRTAFSAGVVTPVWLLLAALLALCCVLPSERVLADSEQVSDDYVYDADRHAQALEKRISELQREYAVAVEKSRMLTDAEIKDLEQRLEGKKNDLKSKFLEWPGNDRRGGERGRVLRVLKECQDTWDKGIDLCLAKVNDFRDRLSVTLSGKERGAANSLVRDCLFIKKDEQKLRDHFQGPANKELEIKELEIMNALWLLERIQRERE